MSNTTQPKRGYYSLIQYCPDASRKEAINLGVVLLCPDAGFLRARTTRNDRRAEFLVGRRELPRKALNAAKLAIERRLELEQARFKGIDDLKRFIETRGNDLQLSEPRPVKVFDPEKDLNRLFGELVGGTFLRGIQSVGKREFAALHETFLRLRDEGKAEIKKRITVPVVGRELAIPFAYRNGRPNFVMPRVFPSIERVAVNMAMHLAIEADLIQRHGIDDCRDARFIVVSAFEDSDGLAITDKVHGLFEDYKVTHIAENLIDEFLEEVIRDAH